MGYSYRNEDRTEVDMGFKAAEGAEDLERELLFPLFQKLTPDHAATQAVSIKHANTILQPGDATANVTINLSVNSQVTIGAKLHLRIAASGGNRTVTLGTRFDDGLASIVVATGKVAFMSFIYDGTNFVPMAYVPAVSE